jgi:hypothetical protein
VSVERIVLITQATRLEGLIRRFNTKGQAKFYIEHAGGDFSAYQAEHDAYHRSLDDLRRALDLGLPEMHVDRELIAQFLVRESDLVVTLGRDGLVANTAKYVAGRPIVAVNPDPARIDGVLLPFLPTKVRRAVQAVAEGKATLREVTMAEARLADGQRLLAFNDLFLGAATHASARYTLRLGDRSEPQSSSGVLVSTGAGSTGWLSSVFQMARGVAGLTGGEPGQGFTLEWDDPRLVFVTREPYVSKHSSAQIVAGHITPGAELVLESAMPDGGVIFSDGVQQDYLKFCSGAVATVRAAAEKARLVAAV